MFRDCRDGEALFAAYWDAGGSLPLRRIRKAGGQSFQDRRTGALVFRLAAARGLENAVRFLCLQLLGCDESKGLVQPRFTVHAKLIVSDVQTLFRPPALAL